MKFGVTFPDLHAAVVADLAAEAEAAGWDGVFVWDAIWGINGYLCLAAAAMRTERVTLGVMLTPLSRRRPWEVANETVTLDHLTQGRMVFPVGLGAIDTGWAKFGEETDARIRAERMDEGLDILQALWKGEAFSYSGTHYQLRDLPESDFRPVQQPRIPIWVVGVWPWMKTMRRVLNYDGLLSSKVNDQGQVTGLHSPADLRPMTDYIRTHRTATTPFDMIVEGELDLADPAAEARAWADAGATWWQENVWGKPYASAGVEGIRQRIRQGPPRL